MASSSTVGYLGAGLPWEEVCFSSDSWRETGSPSWARVFVLGSGLGLILGRGRVIGNMCRYSGMGGVWGQTAQLREGLKEEPKAGRDLRLDLLFPVGRGFGTAKVIPEKRQSLSV